MGSHNKVSIQIIKSWSIYLSHDSQIVHIHIRQNWDDETKWAHTLLRSLFKKTCSTCELVSLVGSLDYIILLATMQLSYLLNNMTIFDYHISNDRMLCAWHCLVLCCYYISYCCHGVCKHCWTACCLDTRISANKNFIYKSLLCHCRTVQKRKIMASESLNGFLISSQVNFIPMMSSSS